MKIEIDKIHPTLCFAEQVQYMPAWLKAEQKLLAAVSNGNRPDTTCEEWVDAEEVHLLAEETKDLPARLGCVTS
jgi:hypothetical protein